jgi:hypothetical protein
MRGTYQEWIGNQLHSNYNASAEKNIITDNAPTGEWPDSWKGIRAANKAIANIDMLQGTEEEKNIILGQAYFFRAYFHFTLIQTWGGMPYIDVFIDSNVDISTISKRLTFQKVSKKLWLISIRQSNCYPATGMIPNLANLPMGPILAELLKEQQLPIKQSIFICRQSVAKRFFGWSF